MKKHIAIGCILLSGCATKQEFARPPHVAFEKFATDRAECNRLTAQNFPINSFHSSGVITAMGNIRQQNMAMEFFNDCMYAKGYQQK